MSELSADPKSLALSAVLVGVALCVSWKEGLGLEKDMIYSVLRMVVQLFLVGYLLTGILRLDNPWLTLVMVVLILGNAAWNAKNYGKGLPHIFRDCLLAILLSTVVSLGILLLTGNIQWTPSQMIPITGMIAGSAMKALGLALSNLKQEVTDNEQKILERTALGAGWQQAGKPVIQGTISRSMQPTLDTIKTLGIVTLPGMMSGMMFAGISPEKAILYQLMVYFMILSASSISCFLVTRMAYPKYLKKYVFARL